MFGSASSLLGGVALGAAVFLVGEAVKALDDYLDEPELLAASLTGPGLAFYAAAALVVACGLAPRAAISLFLGAYAVGMAPSPRRRLPSGLPGWVESVAAVVAAAFLAGPAEIACATSAMAGVQFLDDFWDYAQDYSAGRVTSARAIGRWPALGAGLALTAVSLAVCLSLGLTAVVAGAGIVVRKGGKRFSAVPGLMATLLAATLSASLGGGPVGWQDGPSGLPEGYLLGLLVASVVLAAAVGVVAGYRRGLGEGLERGRAMERALLVLSARADRLDDIERPGGSACG